MSRDGETDNTFGIIIAVAIVIISILCLFYKNYTQNKNAHLISSPNPNPEPTTGEPSIEEPTTDEPHIIIKDLIPKQGLQLWLDATDTSTITFVENSHTDIYLWTSKVNDIKLMADLQTGIGKNPNRNICDAKYPYYHRAQNLFSSSIFFDYQHSATFNKTFGIQTIISLHSFEKETAIQHEEIHGYPHDQFYNFYIFTSHKKTPFHGHCKRLFSNAALPPVKNGKIRLDINEYDMSVKDVKQWEGGDVRIAILECNDVVYDVDRIGADRQHHHFAGSIVELIVYNRVLSEYEKRHVQRYLLDKYYKSYYTSLHAEISSIFNDTRIIKYILSCLVELTILNEFASSLNLN